LAARTGSRVEIAKLSSLTRLSRNAVENYLALFEQSYLIKTIPVTSNSPEREIVKARKLYFLDNGIAGFAASLGSGAKFENAVFNQLRPYGEVSYYALKTGNEIDFVLDKQIAFEAKETASASDLKNARALAKNIDVKQSYVVGRHLTSVFEGFIWGGDIR
jgi:predicted AAA+ superfamily ATPase